jgi:prepilin-type N-terminal cleavage/methylation domain-containing protein
MAQSVQIGWMKDKQHGFSLIELLMVLGVMAILMGMLIPSVGVVRQKAQRMATGQKMRQIGLGVAAYQNITGQALKAGSLGGWIGELATETGIREGKLYLFEEDPMVAASIDSIPPVLVRKTGIANWTVIDGFETFPVGIVAASGVSPMSNPSTTPVAWTRGLTTDGYWMGHDSERAGIYGDEGGFIVFLDGHVEFFRNLEKDGGQLVSFKDGRRTSDIREALGPGVQAYDFLGRVF